MVFKLGQRVMLNELIEIDKNKTHPSGVMVLPYKPGMRGTVIKKRCSHNKDNKILYTVVFDDASVRINDGGSRAKRGDDGEWGEDYLNPVNDFKKVDWEDIMNESKI